MGHCAGVGVAERGTRPPLVLGAYAQGGFLVAHTHAVRHLATAHPTGAELNLQRQTTGAADWHGWCRYPRLGLALMYFDFHNPRLGHLLSASLSHPQHQPGLQAAQQGRPAEIRRELGDSRHVNRKSNLLAGVEGCYDRSLKAALTDTARAGLKRPDVKKIGAFVGYELLFGRLAVVTHLGLYVYAPYKSSTAYYERLGLKYHVTASFSAPST